MPKRRAEVATKRSARARGKRVRRKPAAVRQFPRPSQEGKIAESPAPLQPRATATQRSVKLPTFDYSYVAKDLRNIALLSAFMLAILILLAFLMR